MNASIEELVLTKADKGDIATASKLKAGLNEIQQMATDAVRVRCGLRACVACMPDLGYLETFLPKEPWLEGFLYSLEV
jgi:hypothetical protein